MSLSGLFSMCVYALSKFKDTHTVYIYMYPYIRAVNRLQYLIAINHMIVMS